MLALLLLALAVLFFAAFLKYTVTIHQGWAEQEGERMGLRAESRGTQTVLRGMRDGASLRLVLQGRRVLEGEATFVHPPAGLTSQPTIDPSIEAFDRAKALFGSAHFKRDGVWADFPRSEPGEAPDRYADALAVAVAFAASRTPEELFELERASEQSRA
jgi:hypothetical protein